MDLQQFYSGETFDAYQYFGAHLTEEGAVFRTYAPNAQGVAVEGEFTGWREVALAPLYRSGVWELTLPGAREGQMYKYVVYGQNGRAEHCDPYGFGMELRPGACSILRELSSYTFGDQAWMESRSRCLDKPLNIYELHLGSWKRRAGGEWYTYRETAGELIPYLLENGYNYVEFLPLSEHPFDGSWGYQNTGFFAPTSRYGTPLQLMELVDRLHQAGIGAILDFVPVHFAVDGYGLAKFDGTPLYEYPSRDVGESEWGSYNFIHSRREVACFLQSAAHFWLEEYHFDGLRMDAVSRLLYWQGDERRGVNGPAVDFLKRMNRGLHALHPTAMLIAEDSTNYPGVTRPVEEGGLGFDYKWDLGWMHDTLDQLQRLPGQRAELRPKFAFSMEYFPNERYLLPLSHDEVVHGKKTILDKMPGTYREKFDQTRALFLYMMAHPGKKLSFMGSELAMFREWDEQRQMDWELLKMPMHDAFRRFMAALNKLYLEEPALWELDYRREGFSWAEGAGQDPRTLGFYRQGSCSRVLALFNFSDQRKELDLPEAKTCRLLLDTAWETYGGTEQQEETSLRGSLPPFSGRLYRCGS